MSPSKRLEPKSRFFRRVFISLFLLLVLIIPGQFGNLRSTQAQVSISFGQAGLQGENLSNPTSLEFGPDNRLYVSEQGQEKRNT